MPLAFLPSVLEDRGHRPMVIATAIGVYYWTGFAGGLLITGYQIMRLMRSQGGEVEEASTVGVVRAQLGYLFLGLCAGSVTLVLQAMNPVCWVHTACRFFQGFAGAFIFFYAFLLSVGMFQGQQQVFAMTLASVALNIAEVLGSSLGAWIFQEYGESSVFWFLGIVSVANQVILLVILGMVQGNGVINSWQSSADFSPTPAGLKRLRALLRSRRLGSALILIGMAAVVKASIEEVLPFHADHCWNMGPLQIGNLFSMVAIAYIGAAIIVGNLWHYLREQRVLFAACWLAALGLTAWCVLLTASICKKEVALWAGLAAYGACLGLTHTPAALLLADTVEHQEGREKDAANGIWNTMWEAGGSLGFLLGGLLAEDYGKQLSLFGSYAICCVASAALMLMVSGLPSGESVCTYEGKPCGDTEAAKAQDTYGATS